MKTIIIYDALIDLDRTSLPVGKDDDVELFPLTSHLSVTQKLEAKVKEATSCVSILTTASFINESADALRKPYIDLIGKLPKEVQQNGKNFKEWLALDEHVSLWWLSFVAEKNTLKSDVFNKLAQLDAIIRVVREQSIEKIIWGCSSQKLSRAVAEYARTGGIHWRAVRTDQPRGWKARMKNYQGAPYLKHFCSLVVSVFAFFRRAWKVKKSLGVAQRKDVKPDDRMMITPYPCFDQTAAAQGKFVNKFYAPLQRALTGGNHRLVWVALYVPNSTTSFEKVLRQTTDFCGNGETIYFLEEFCSLKAQLSAFGRIFKKGLTFLRFKPAIAARHQWNGYNFYPVVEDDWYASFVGAKGYEGIMFYEMFKMLLKKFSVKKCLYFLEMQAWEKALLGARSAVRSSTALLGYQHATIPYMVLNHFNSFSETQQNGAYPIARPDKIICNGPVTCGYMKESGWREDEVAMAEAIRFEHLKSTPRLRLSGKKSVVLVILSINLQETDSILNYVYAAFNGRKDIHSWIKPHPFVESDKAIKTAGIDTGDLSFEVKHEPIEELLVEAKVVVVGGSTTVAIEALSYGCEVVIMNMPEWINMRLLRKIPDQAVAIVDSADELRQKVAEMLQKEVNQQSIEAEAREVIDQFFFFDHSSDKPKRLLQFLEA